MKDYETNGITTRIERVFGGRYQLLGRLGSGGMGMVFLVQARDLSGIRYALKVVDKSSPENMGVDVYSEIRMLRDLKHPNIVTVFEAVEDSDYVYIVQEYINGRTLAELRDDPSAQAALTDETIKLWMMDIADALAYIHRCGIIHRDIKPGNIMIDSDGRAKLIDFGIARRSSTLRRSLSGSTVGSAPYSPLERLQGKADGEQTDIYAYGASFYSLICRRIPSVSGREINTLRTNDQSIEPYYMSAYRTMVGDLEYIEDDAIRELIRGCIDIDPDQRVSDFNTVRYNLRSIQKEETEFHEEKKSLRKTRNAFIALLIAGILCTGLGIVQMKRDHVQKYDAIIAEADAAFDNADYEAGEEAARRAIEFDPNNEAGYITKYKVLTARAYEESDDSYYEQVISEVENDRITQPSLQNNLYVATYAANAYYELGRYEEAVEELDGRDDLGDDQLLLLGEAYYNLGDFNRAPECLDRISENVPQKYYLEGLIKQDVDYKGAVRSYLKVLEYDNTDGKLDELRRKALSQAAKLYMDHKEYDQAIRVIKDGFDSDATFKNSGKINLMLLEAYYQTGNYSATISQADFMIEHFPIAVAYNRKSNAQAWLGNITDSLKTIDEWEAAFPDDPAPHIQKTIIYNNIAVRKGTPENYRNFIKVYEEERDWLNDHNAMNEDFLALEPEYEKAKFNLEHPEG